MKVYKYDSSFLQEWDNFVDDSQNGNLFHKMNFLSYHEEGKFSDCSILVKDEKNKLVAVFPAADINNTIVSHLGSTYGGVIFKKNLKLFEKTNILEIIIEYYKGLYQNFSIKMIIQENFISSINDDFYYLLWYFNFELSSKEISVCIDVKDFLSYVGMRKTTKQYIRSEKINKLGIDYCIADNDEIKDCYSLIKKNLKEKYNKEPTHTYQEIVDLKKKFPDDILFFLAKKDSVVLVTYVLFRLNDKIWHTFYIAKNEIAENISDIGLVSFIIDFLNQNNYQYLNFGISSREKEIKWAIHNYKEQYSKRLLTRDVWILDCKKQE